MCENRAIVALRNSVSNGCFSGPYNMTCSSFFLTISWKLRSLAVAIRL